MITLIAQWDRGAVPPPQKKIRQGEAAASGRGFGAPLGDSGTVDFIY